MARSGAGWRGLLILPFGFGVAAGLALVVIDRLIAALSGGAPLVHPQFPMSLLASLSAGIGEEILFRGLVMGLWAWLLNLLFNRWIPKPVIFIIANLIAALAFSAGHLPSAMVLAGVSSPALLPTGMILEIVLLNSLLGLLAGWRSQKDGLAAAIGVHFWADIVWHVIVPLLLV
jgi:membrane protease YdiL (CAAX protease family)